MAVVEVGFEGWEGGGWLDGHVCLCLFNLIAYIYIMLCVCTSYVVLIEEYMYKYN